MSTNDTACGTKTRFACDECYDRIGNSSLTCLPNGEWDNLVPTCQYKNCSILSAPDNGLLSSSDRGCNQSVHVSCKECYSLQGNETLTCLTSANWSQPVGLCNRIHCPLLNSPTNGHISSHETTCNTTTHFTCSVECFNLSGPSFLTCHSSGVWNFEPPECLAVHCPLLDEPVFGSMSSIQTVCGTVTQIMCEPCYSLVGNSSLACLSNGEWNDTIPVCQYKQCPILEVPENGFLSTTDRSCSTSVAVGCDECYDLYGSDTLTCQETGDWNQSVGSCQVIHCSHLSLPTNGHMSSNETQCNTTTLFSCNECYYLSGVSSLTCLPSGHWDFEVPSCNLIRCSILEAPDHGSVHIRDTNCYAVAQFACDQGYDLIGNWRLTCLPNGDWDSIVPTCYERVYFHSTSIFSTVAASSFFTPLSQMPSSVAFMSPTESLPMPTPCHLITCPHLKYPVNGSISTGNNTCNTTVKFTCDNCYVLVGRVNLTCQINGQWDGNPPLCTAVYCSLLMTPYHGKKSSNSTNCQTVVEFSCDDGFVLSGRSHLICQSNGKWDNLNPVCEDVNECLSFPCQNNGSCLNTFGSFRCICTAYFMGTYCHMSTGNMYSFGTSQNDFSLPALDDYSHGPIAIRVGCFPFARQSHQSVYISTNAVISFDRPFLSPYPRVFPGFTYTSIVAPFWSDVDIRRDGMIFYNVYEASFSTYIERATKDVRDFTGDNFFTAQWVLVATWYQVPNYPDGSGSYSDSLSDRRNTYQVVLATDGKQTFSLFNYPSDGLQWSGRGTAAVVGYTSHDASVFYSHYLSGFDEVINLVSHRSDNGQVGQLLYQVSEDTNICAGNSVCLNWYFDDIDREGVSPIWYFSLPPCPCSLVQAASDWAYQWYRSTSTSVCYVSSFPSPFYDSQVQCCYSLPEFGFFDGFLLNNLPQGGTANRYHASRFSLFHSNFDIQPYEDCCIKTDLCNLYYLRRPSQSCFGYFPPFWAWTWGDPHISTLDGKQYTFNGVGEYILMQTVNETFVLEGRTRLVENSSATVFSAFAAAEFIASTGFSRSLLKSSVIHTELMDDNTLRVKACCYSLEDTFVSSDSTLKRSSWREFSGEFAGLDNVTRLRLDNMVLARPADKKLVAVFSSGISVTVEIKKALLTVVFAAPNTFKGNTRGLLGVWDDDKSNDLTARNGTVVSINSTDREIHHLSQTWQVFQNESLFYYDDGNDVTTFSDPNHIPVFPDEAVSRYTGEQRTACNDDPQCLFDTFETNDPEIGQETLVTNAQLIEQSTSLMNFPPVLNGSHVLNATLGQTVRYVFVGSDSDAFNVTVEGIPPPLADYTFARNGDEFVFIWTPASSGIVSLLFIANDTTGSSSQLQPLIRLCACRLEKNAVCIIADGDGGEEQFILELCECGSGWEGRFCSVDIDACLTSNCPEGTNCTDRSAPDTGFDCGSCSAGLELVAGKCEDIDECNNATLNYCHQVCSNQMPFYKCECFHGFRLDDDDANCSDIDECIEGVPCHLVCNNIPGSYWCSCDSGFRLDSDNITCIRK
ncbi:mucin-like protein [Corticium candelabrum]|uniref:mucin-like protein n=1 Tax=Corticium candelabrum TaxID=121492 RepID=UPI002E26F993|nr:mucin-like protein [Corticium candelabrum]